MSTEEAVRRQPAGRQARFAPPLARHTPMAPDRASAPIATGASLRHFPQAVAHHQGRADPPPGRARRAASEPAPREPAKRPGPPAPTAPRSRAGHPRGRGRDRGGLPSAARGGGLPDARPDRAGRGVPQLAPGGRRSAVRLPAVLLDRARGVRHVHGRRLARCGRAAHRASPATAPRTADAPAVSTRTTTGPQLPHRRLPRRERHRQPVGHHRAARGGHARPARARRGAGAVLALDHPPDRRGTRGRRASSASTSWTSTTSSRRPTATAATSPASSCRARRASRRPPARPATPYTTVSGGGP